MPYAILIGAVALIAAIDGGGGRVLSLATLTRNTTKTATRHYQK